MLRKLANTITFNKNILRKIGNNFSSNPEPNQNNEPQKTPNIDPPKPKVQQGKNLRSQARIFVCRSQLNKYAKAEVDYEKLNIPTKQMEKVQKALEIYGIKIKHVVDKGPLIEFHRAQQIIRKQQKRQEKVQKQQSDPQQKVQQEQEDIKLQYKIYTRPFKQLTTSQFEIFEKYFITPEEMVGQKDSQSQKLSKKNMFGVTKKSAAESFSNNSMKSFKNFYDIIQDVYKSQADFFLDKKEKKQDDDKFKEFNLYMRDARKQGTKWVKFELVIENWMTMHFYRISLVDNSQEDAKNPCNQSPHKYVGPLAKQLDKQVLELLKLSFESVQQIDPISFLPIYYFTGLREQQCYRKWLQEMVEFTK